MSKPNDGGPAFPRPFSEDHARSGLEYAETGMSLRDWFAGMASNAFGVQIANCFIDHVAALSKGDVKSLGISTPEEIAHIAYAVADAMLAERAKGAEA